MAKPPTKKTSKVGLQYILGLDLGPGSVGWAIVKCNAANEPKQLLDAGVRRFDAGVDGGSEKISAGRDEPRALARRNARSLRRSTWRRRRRMATLFRVLSQNGFLPECGASSEEQHETLLRLDAELRQQVLKNDSQVDHHLLPYILRAKALDEQVTDLEFGRAIYHLAQRRGYKSNRKTETSDEDRGVVAAGISDLQNAIQESNCRTVGEFFTTLDPEQERIRGRWTAREMFVDEFNQIWNKQSQKQPKKFTRELRNEIFGLIFDQRKLKSQKHLIGKCELEPNKRRALKACLPFQEFRMLQRVNDLELIKPDGEILELESDHRLKLIENLNVQGDMTWAGVRKLLGLTKKDTIAHEETEDGKTKAIKRGYTFNFELGGDKKLLGNRTAAKLRNLLAETWDDLEQAKQSELVDEILSFESERALAKRLETAWKIDPVTADAVSRVVLEKDYASHSRKAINKLLPRLRNGDQYAKIRREVYPEQFESTEIYDLLPPVLNAPGFDQVKNPSVIRTLTELRKVVNAITRQYGKPKIVRIELARDLKHARKRREEYAAIRDKNEKERTAATKKIIAETNDESYLRNKSNILKVRLAEECNWICPYSGKQISMHQLVISPQFEIEHIIPYSKCFDNSFVNKTLCHVKWNREKANRTPFEAFGGRPEFEEMLARVNQFQGGLANRKLAIFSRKDQQHKEDFTNRMLSDTRYICRKACEYLGVLFGGVIDANGDRCVQALPGRCTANLRNNWDLNRILGHPAKKERADHRHHAIDAVVIAVTSAGLVQKMSKAAETAERQNTKILFDPIELPWSSFQKDVKQSIENMIVSSRVNKRLNGSLHKETILSHPKDENGKGESIHHVRKPIQLLSAKEVDAIVDPVIRDIIQKALNAAGQPPAKAFAEPQNTPHLFSKKDPSRVIPIRRVRIRKSDKPMPVGKKHRKRYVNPGSNSHMEIVAVVDSRGNEKKWEGHIVSRYDAMTRKRNDEPVVNRDHGEKVFKFSICPTEHLQIIVPSDDPQSKSTTTTKIIRVLSISDGDVECIDHQDARPAGIRRKDGSRLRFSLSKLMKHNAKKVVITPLGNVIDAND